jgi:hypothetical protein
MALTSAEKQARYRARQRDKQGALEASHPDALERALLLEVERYDQMSDRERIALAEKLADLAKDFLWRAHRLSKMAHKLRTGEDHPLQR